MTEAEYNNKEKEGAKIEGICCYNRNDHCCGWHHCRAVYQGFFKNLLDLRDSGSNWDFFLRHHDGGVCGRHGDTG